MSRIQITGDIHGVLDIQRILDIDYLTTNDYVVVVGDFGFPWNNSENEKDLFQQLVAKPFTTLFIDGNHENFTLLNKYEEKTWNGGKVHFLSDNIIHLMRGQVFTINNKKFFTFGGASSTDKYRRMNGIDWWEEELPSYKEMDEGISNLEKYNYSIDYVLTHTCRTETLEMLCRLYGFRPNPDCLNKYLESIYKNLNFSHWYFGHYHKDLPHVMRNETVLFREIKNIE
ncbi:metallophosphoesterase [Bacillus cereus]|uniref:metallophosphoesterase n=1 Tax=Bacillus cereus TaxID=1396 RepID=UPI000BF5678C|nr:metallophosphoesterase [Bacillus cereus]PFQ26879.1 metallophosphatase [Bacillus cereus]